MASLQSLVLRKERLLEGMERRRILDRRRLGRHHQHYLPADRSLLLLPFRSHRSLIDPSPSTILATHRLLIPPLQTFTRLPLRPLKAKHHPAASSKLDMFLGRSFGSIRGRGIILNPEINTPMPKSNQISSPNVIGCFTISRCRRPARPTVKTATVVPFCALTKRTSRTGSSIRIVSK